MKQKEQKQPDKKPTTDVKDELMRLNISIFRRVAKARPDLVAEEYRKLRMQAA
jgi:hypothetical protein